MKLNITFIILLFSISIFSQELPDNDELNIKLGTEQTDFDILELIQTPLDFEQSNMSIEDVDLEIKKIIENQSNKDLENLIVPINEKKIEYLGFIHPSSTGIFYSNFDYFLNYDLSIKGNSSHIYKYENLYISSIGNKVIDRYLIYYTIRAHIILKYRFPEMFDNLFVQTALVPTRFSEKFNSLDFVNLTKNYFITYDGNKLLPENNAYLGTKYRNSDHNFDIYPNTQIIYLNKETIKNGGSTGTVKIYEGLTDMSQKFHKYMRDGFIHTFVHEKIHDWIFQYKHLNALAKFLRLESQSSGLVNNYYPFEEAIVNNTTNILFESENNNGGLSEDVLKFYRKEFDISLVTFKSGENYNKLVEKFEIFSSKNNKYDESESYIKSMENKLFMIDFENLDNIPTEK